MGLLDQNYKDQRLTNSQKKNIKPAIQGGGYNYLGKQETVTVPKKWLSDPDHVVAELAYITPREKKVLIDLNMYGSLDGKPNNAPGGLPSLQGDMGSIGGGGSPSGGDGGNTREGYATQTQYTRELDTPKSDGGYKEPELPPGVVSKDFDYETEAYQEVPTNVVPQFNQEGKFTGLKTDDVGIVNAEDYQTANIEGYLGDSTISDKDKVDLLNQLQAIANSKYDTGKPNVDLEAKEFIQNNLESVLNNIKQDSFYDDYTSQIDPEAATYVDTFREKPISTFAKSGFSLTGLVVKSVADSYKNQKALETLGYTGTTLSPDYAETGGGLLSSPEYLTGQVTGGKGVGEAITQLPGLISGQQLPASVFESFFSNVGQAGVDIMNRYDAAKQNLNTIAFAPSNSLSYGIFADAKLKGLI